MIDDSERAASEVARAMVERGERVRAEMRRPKAERVAPAVMGQTAPDCRCGRGKMRSPEPNTLRWRPCGACCEKRAATRLAKEEKR